MLDSNQMKKIAFTLLLALATTVSHAETSTGDLTLRSQTDIDGFNFTEVTGNLTINDVTAGDITNLDGLSELSQIGGNLTITSNATLTSLSGLDALTDIGGFLDISANTSLASLNGLEMLDSIGGRLIITENPILTDFCTISTLVGNENDITKLEYTVNTNGYNPAYTFIQTETLCSPSAGIFDGNLILTSQEAIDTFNYTVITGNLTINDGKTGNIINLSALEFLTDIGGNLSIQFNDSLTSLSGLDALTNIGGGLNIGANPTLSSLSGLDFLTSVGGRLLISYNASLRSLSGLDALTNIGENLSITFNSTLTSLSGLDSLTDIGGFLLIFSNATLTSLSGLDALNRIGGNLTILFNVTLTSLSGLDALTEIGGSLDIRENPTLMSLSVLDALTDIGGNLTIQFNASLTSLSGLDALTNIGGFLKISGNFTLTSLSGLEMLDSIGSRLIIIDNPILTDFCAISPLIGDENQITRADYAVSGNSYNPTYTAIQITTRCRFDPPVVAIALPDVIIQPGDIFATINLESFFSDANGDVFTYTVTSSDENIVTVSVSGDMLTLTEVGAGTATITVIASDGDMSVSGTFMAIISQNNAPIRTAITFPQIPAVEVGFQLPAVNLTPFFSDPDGDALTYTATTGDSTVVTVEIVETSSVTFTAIGVGTTTLTVTATDPKGLFVIETVMITVNTGTLGIADTDILDAYPNPSSGLFQLSRIVDVVRVYDMSGRLVYRGNNTKQLDLTIHPSGPVPCGSRSR